ncbi:MAG TPA: bifunctional (p)ppGpp synthetase/guanosine-3',5'-bis(diphosphate) 3'-pyrophosphohydrolase [Alphaproteobacteria bacterium]|nr:bifunctional (p)ppGpp synthetase/guanosine-3',5'-bis(diphosphate) 3'-pyrophosphohydrolase [Alphaproteobacteria bacterium]
MIGTADSIIERMRGYNPAIDVERLGRAFAFGRDAHDGQMRASGEPYFTHPIAVANILIDMRLDEDTVITALLHDTVEDCDVTLSTLDQQFGGDVPQLVDGVTKLSRIAIQSSPSSAQAENFRKLLLAMSEDVRVLLVKLADRTHNMRTLSFIKKPDKQQRIARETMDIFAPLAERIGLTRIQQELEDNAFAVLNGEMRQSIINRLDFLTSEAEITIPTIAVELQDTLSRIGLECSVSGRMKSAYSIWRKMQNKAVTMDQLADIMAFRVLVPGTADCYAALGQLHQNYPTVMGRFKDYISTPKRNGYQSLHTGVLGPQNHRIEVQIRTPEMHEVAEHGVAAHWIYKETRSRSNSISVKWIQELVGILDEEAGADEFLEHTKLDLYRDQVFCFTPRGDLISLPRGATAVDFAYAVHTKIGETCNGVRINGKARQLATELENGDQIEILTAEDAKPKAEWEGFVQTARAKSAIRRFQRAQRVTEFSRIGKTLIEKTFREYGKPFRSRTLERSLAAFGLTRVDEVFALVGEDRLSPLRVLEKMHPDVIIKEKADDDRRQKRAGRQPQLKISGDDAGVAVTIARCCHPLPGEAIVGIFTTGKGVTVHKVGCTTLSKFTDMPELWLDVSWESGSLRMVNGRLITVLSNEPGSLASLATVISQQGGNISNINLTDRTPDFFKFELDLEVKDVEHMRAIIAVLSANKYVESVARADSR